MTILYYCTCEAVSYDDDDCPEHGKSPHWERHLDEYGQSYYTEIVTND
jgi:hypothetical protein